MVRGQERWVLDFGERHGKRHRTFHKSEAEAVTARNKAEKEAALAGRWWAMVPEDEKHDAIRVFKAMRDSGLSPSDVWNAYQQGELEVKERRTLKEAIEETIQAKTESNRRERYVSELRNYLLKFASGRTEMAVSQITAKDIDQWFAGRGESPTTRKSNLGRLSSMFGLCVRRGYLKTNPCEQVEAVIIDQKPPTILTVKQVDRLLRVCRRKTPKLLPYVIMGVLAGCRPDEVRHMKWQDVDLKRKRYHVNFKTTKIRHWRISELPEPAVAWLRVVQKSKRVLGPIAPHYGPIRKLRRKLRDALGMPTWPQDILRHTAASHLLGFHRDEQKVALMIGTSPKILFKNYRTPVHPEDAKAFMRLKP